MAGSYAHTPKRTASLQQLAPYHQPGTSKRQRHSVRANGASQLSKCSNEVELLQLSNRCRRRYHLTNLTADIQSPECALSVGSSCPEPVTSPRRGQKPSDDALDFGRHLLPVPITPLPSQFRVSARTQGFGQEISRRCALPCPVALLPKDLVPEVFGPGTTAVDDGMVREASVLDTSVVGLAA